MNRASGSPQADADNNQGGVGRSTDGGGTWSAPIDIRIGGVNRGPMALNFGNCFGILGDKVLLATTDGVYRSEDEGLTWKLLPGALAQ